MLYKIVITEDAEQDIDDTLEYLARKCSLQDFNAVKNDMEYIIDLLEKNPYIFPEYAKDAMQRKAHLQNHRFKYIFFINRHTVYITAFLHDLQDK